MEIGHWVISAICGLWDPWLCFIHVFTANIHHMAAATNILEMMMMVTKTMTKTMAMAKTKTKTKTKTKALCMYSQPISIICRLPRISLRWQGRGWWKPFIVKQQAWLANPLVEWSQVKIVKFQIIRLSIQFLGDGHGLMKIGPQSRKSGSYRTTIYSWRFSLLYEREKFEVQEEKRKPWLVFFHFFIIRIWWG